MDNPLDWTKQFPPLIFNMVYIFLLSIISNQLYITHPIISHCSVQSTIYSTIILALFLISGGMINRIQPAGYVGRAGQTQHGYRIYHDYWRQMVDEMVCRWYLICFFFTKPRTVDRLRCYAKIDLTLVQKHTSTNWVLSCFDVAFLIRRIPLIPNLPG